ncbi:hypothetical protein ACEWY4_015953 [Coilia grayii]|uniref:Pre-mRNA 3'-end-processing factor FIP1 n=1 Tax=Coilia grayii TaxID=363190 RepID=A0ABD1JQA3_9TELE
MSTDEVDTTTTTEASEGDENLEWLYGDESEKQDSEEEEAKLPAVLRAPTSTTQETTGNEVDSQAPAPQYMTAPVNLNMEFSSHRNYDAVAAKPKGVDLEAPGSINGVPALQVDMESFEEKPWRKPGVDLSDYFNYGFNEDTWKAYCDERKRRPIGLDVMNMSSHTSKTMIKQARKGNTEKDVVNLTPRTAKSHFITSTNIYKSGMNTTRKSSGTIDVIRRQTASIDQVEGQRCSYQDGNRVQVILEHPSDSEPTPGRSPGPQSSYIPPTPFLPPLSITASPLTAPPNEREKQDNKKEKAKLTPAARRVKTSAPPPALVMQETTGNGVDSQETLADDENSESDDEVQVTIGYIKPPASVKMTYAARPVDGNIKSLGRRYTGADDSEKRDNEKKEDRLTAAVSAPSPALVTQETTGNGVDSQEMLSDDKYSESDSDDNLQITIGNIKSPAEQEMTNAATSVHCNMNSFSHRVHGRVSCNKKCLEFDGSLSVCGIPELEFSLKTLEDGKDIPWRNPGADLSDHFNYGFDEETWKAYNDKQIKLRRHFLKIPANSIAMKIIQWRENTEKDVVSFTPHTAKSDFSTSTNIHESGIHTTSNGHPGGYDVRSVPLYTLPEGGHPSPVRGAVASWATMVDSSTQCDCYPWCEKEREKERERKQPREPAHERERRRELERSPLATGYTSDEERHEYRDYPEHGYERHHERTSQEKEERRRERRHRDKEGRGHKSCRSCGHPGDYDGRPVPPYTLRGAACRSPVPGKVASVPSMERSPWAKKEQEKKGEQEQLRERAYTAL